MGRRNLRILTLEGAWTRWLDLRSLLLVQEDMKIVAESRHGFEAVVMAMDRRPDMVLIDGSWGAVEIERMTSTIREVSSDSHVLVATERAHAGNFSAAIESGACLCQCDDAEQILAAMRAMWGESTLGQLERADSTRDLGPRLGLSSRDLRILQLISIGHTNAQIARALSLTPGTIRVYVSAILHRLGANNRTEAAHLARGLGAAGTSAMAGRASMV